MLNIVRKIKEVFQSLYVYFFCSPKRIQEFIELANIVEPWGQHILRNIKIGWISMLLVTKRVLGSKHDKICQKSSPKKIQLKKQFVLDIHIQKDIKTYLNFILKS